jgi:hypothetical protein
MSRLMTCPLARPVVSSWMLHHPWKNLVRAGCRVRTVVQQRGTTYAVGAVAKGRGNGGIDGMSRRLLRVCVGIPGVRQAQIAGGVCPAVSSSPRLSPSVLLLFPVRTVDIRGGRS